MENSLAVYNNENRRKSISFIPEKSEVITLIIDQLKQSSDELIFNNNFYFYEDGYWQKKDEYLIKKFIQNFAYERGFDEKYYKPYKKADDLYNQAMLDFYTEISSNKGVINFKNGSYELDNMVFREHRKDDFVFHCLSYDYDAQADCPKWKAFIKEVLPQEDLQIAIQEALAYPLSKMHLEKIIYLFGNGRNGKSLSLEVITNVLGNENVSHVPLINITKNDGLALQQMENKLINISYENSSKIFDTSALKSYISGEALNVKRLYQDSYSTTNYPQSLMASNSMPQSDDFSEGFYRRFRFIPFNVTIPKEKVNPNLKEELCQESAGILNWLLEGVRRLRENKKFTYSPTIEALQNEYRIESDNVSMFLDEKMYIPSLKNKQLLSQLYNEFDTFSNGNGFRTMSNRTFSSRMKSLGFKVEKGGTGNQTYVWLEIDSKKNEIIAQEKQIIENKANLLEADDYFPDEKEPPF
ncbi:MAG: phage/plasmid primase, P4 family [Bacteroidales bacterium]|nr:phage/plasmid primase, P4 family [Bacteroidales bacterium]